MKSSSKPLPALEDTLKAIVPDKFDPDRLPPVDLWNPEGCGDIGMEIRADGTWWHEGTRITRQRLVRLFARILRKDADGVTYLVTPYEKVIVHVADAHFRAVRADRVDGPGDLPALKFTTQLGDTVLAGPDAPIRVAFNPVTGEPSPYVRVRGRLEARIDRAVYYELASLVEPNPADGGRTLGVCSLGQFFVLGPAA